MWVTNAMNEWGFISPSFRGGYMYQGSATNR